MDPAIFIAFTICFIVWVIFSSIRRYLIAKTKAGLQEKILQRIDSSDALASLAANESGRRFLESITVEENKTSSPFGRILFGIQAGIVLFFFGAAMSSIPTEALSS
jgi:sugar-specific transcriptional regulator TrmB